MKNNESGARPRARLLVPTLTFTAAAAILMLAIARGTPTGQELVAATVVALCGVLYVRYNRAELARQERQLATAIHRLGKIEGRYRNDRALMHELNAAMAGIASARQLLDTLPAERRDNFESMIDAEIDRVTRLLGSGPGAAPEPVAVDDVLAPLVVSHRARGRGLAWEPSHLRAIARRDDVATAVNVLLENAARHGSPGDIVLTTEARGRTVQVSVHDSGPGVPADLRESIFDWGTSRPDSPGQGIGLHVARELVRRLGGELRLAPTVDGARFVLSLPAASAAAEGLAELAEAS